MNEGKIIEIVKSVLSGKSDSVASLNEAGKPEGALDEYKVCVAERLISGFSKYKSGLITNADFELLMRDYLLVFKGQVLSLPNYEVSDLARTLGIVKNGDEISIPLLKCEQVNSTFLRSAFMEGVTEVPKDTSRFCLATNQFIRELTGYKSFKSEEQKVVVTAALNCPPGFTELVCMSTGGGKSLVTQCISYQREGSLTIAVVPTVSLMIDQVRVSRGVIKNASADEIDCYYSGVGVEKIISAIKRHKLRLLFVSPEALLKNYALRETVEEAAKANYLANLIIDEAHIVLEWGTLFRTDYQCLDALQKTILGLNPNLRTFLMSATFSKETVKQLKNLYSKDEKWIEVRCDKLREEIRFCFIQEKDEYDKKRRLEELILQLPHPMIVYVQRPMQATQIVNRLKEMGISSVEEFTGKTSNSKRETLIERWINDEFPIMVATCAFGVGVNKKDVRTVLHTYVPEGPNKYYQETGRGGRDGLPSLGVVLYTTDDIASAKALTQKTITSEKLHGRWFSMLNHSSTIFRPDGTIELDTSIKPKYLEDQELIDLANARDINWNVYVILLLRRAGLIDVLGVRYEGENVVLSLRVINPLMRDPYSEETKAILEQVRTVEWRIVDREFEAMKLMLANSNRKCVSDTFVEIYGYAERLCSGCASHVSLINEEPDNVIPIKKKITYPSLCEPWIQDDILLIAQKGDSAALVAELAKLNISAFILQKRNYPIHEMTRNNISFLYFNEWDPLFQYYPSLFAGVCVIDLTAMKEVDILRVFSYSKVRRISSTRFIFVVDEDIYLDGKNRPLSELFEGETLSGQIFIRRYLDV